MKVRVRVGTLTRSLTLPGAAWSVHRVLWMLALRLPTMRRALQAIDQAPGWLRRPLRMLRLLRHVPISPCISLYLPVSPYISCWLRLRRERRALAAAHAAALAAGGSGGGSGGGEGGGKGARRRRAHAQPRGSSGAKAARPTLGEALSPAEGEQLGRALAQHASIFSWARGDVLLIDNARVLHDGEPLTLTPKPEP